MQHLIYSWVGSAVLVYLIAIAIYYYRRYIKSLRRGWKLYDKMCDKYFNSIERYGRLRLKNKRLECSVAKLTDERILLSGYLVQLRKSAELHGVASVNEFDNITDCYISDGNTK